jgi:PAS domain S-box-containing protein
MSEPALGLLGLLLLVGIGAWTLGLRPLREIQRALRAAAQGDFSSPARVARASPLAPLATALDRMLERVRAARSELEESNRNLEGIVEARTRELRRSERKYRSLVGQASVGILLWDPKTLRIQEANARAGELFGERPRDLLQRSVSELLDASQREHAVRALRGVSEVGNVRLEETLLERRHHGCFPAEIAASLVRFGDQAVVLGILQDLTEKRELERRAALLNEQVRRTEKMASIGQLAAGVAHEINNPMGYVASNINRLVEYAKRLGDMVQSTVPDAGSAALLSEVDDLVGELEEIAQEASEGVARVTDIVKALREFSHGGQSLESVQWADLNNVVKNCSILIHNEVKNRAQLELDLSPIPRVRCHSMQIAQVLMNLLRNSAQAMEGTGLIRIETHSAGDRVQIAVEDNGCGIPAEHLPRIFEPFFTTKEVGHGTGLGLAVSSEIIARHGGALWVDSRVGRGSRFLLELPVDSSSTEPERDTPPER